MKAYLVLDNDEPSTEYAALIDLVRAFFTERGFDVAEQRIGRGDLATCIGCFGCWIKKPGECVIGDKMAELNRTYMSSDVGVYISPVVFGQFSPNIKTAVERWLPNMLPFFEVRADGSTMHTARYKMYPKLIVIGCGARDESDARLFADITRKHRSNADVILHTDASKTLAELGTIKLERAGGTL